MNLDPFLGGALQALPQLGVVSAIAWVLILLLRREATSETRHAAEMDRLRKAHDEELAEVHVDIDRERAARRRAEDEREQLREVLQANAEALRVELFTLRTQWRIHDAPHNAEPHDQPPLGGGR